MQKEVGIFGLGPGTVIPAHELPNSTIFTLKGQPERRSIYTTNRGNEQKFNLHVPIAHRLPMDSIRVVSTRGTDFKVPTGDRYFMIDYPAVVNGWLDKVRERILFLSPETAKQTTVREHPDGVTVQIDGTEYEFDSVIDGTGIRAAVIRQVDLERANEDFAVQWICYGTFRGEAPEGEMIMVFGPGGGQSWINRSIYSRDQGEPLVDLAFSGWGYYSQFPRFISGDGRQRLDALREFATTIPGVYVGKDLIDLTYGMIRSQPAPSPTSRKIFPVGEAVGIAKPKTGESFNRSLVSGELAKFAIENGLSPAHYHRMLRSRYKGDDFFFAVTLLSIDHQLEANVTRHVDALQRWFNTGILDQKAVDQFEEFLIDGRLSPRLLIKFFRDSAFRKSIMEALKYLIKIKIGRNNHLNSLPEYTYPDLEAAIM